MKTVKTLVFDIVARFFFLQVRLEMSTVKLLGVWLSRPLNSRCYNPFVVGNTRINHYETPHSLRHGRGFGTVSEKEANVTAGRKGGLRAVDIAEKLRREKEEKTDTTYKVC